MELSNLLFLFTIIGGLSYSQQQCTTFPAIREGQYSKKYKKINYATETDRPLGFLKSTVVYQTIEANPCFSVTGVIGQYLEFKFETIPTMKLCVRERGSGPDVTFCDDGRHSSCRAFSQATMEYEIYCSTGDSCAEADVNFWLRITEGPNPKNDTEGMWCSNLWDKYPEGLRELPPGFIPEPDNRPVPIDGAMTVVPSVISVAAMFVLYMAVR